VWKCPYGERENMKEKTYEYKGKKGEEHTVQNERKTPSVQRKEKNT
jgi:hypothetical protein